MAETTGNIPLDTRLLSDAIIELSISRRNVSIYPRNHPIVKDSLNRAFTLINKIFELRSEITLAIAKDTLIIDSFYLDKNNPVYRLKEMDKACGLRFYALHPFNKQRVRACRAEYPKDTEKKDILGIQGRPQNKIEGEEKQSCEEILIEGDEHARVLKSQLSVQDSEHSES